MPVRSGKIVLASKYKMSFTACPLLWQDSIKIATLYMEFHDWQAVKTYAQENNSLQARTTSALNRITREICFRLSTLTDEEIEFFVEGEPREQKALLWVALCRRHRFIREFALEVLRERWVTFRHDLRYEDYDAFFYAKEEWDETLERMAVTTRKKLRQVLFLMMREADLLTSGNIIQQALLTPRLIALLIKQNRQDLLVFPAYEPDLKG